MPLPTISTILLFLVSVGFLFWDLRLLTLAHASHMWPTVTGTITSSKAVYRVMGEGAAWFGQLRYKYLVKGKEFVGRRVDYFNFLTTTLRRILARYPVGKNVVVYYHPHKPAIAVLEPGIRFPHFIWTALLIGLTLVIGVGAWGK